MHVVLISQTKSFNSGSEKPSQKTQAEVSSKLGTAQDQLVFFLLFCYFIIIGADFPTK